MTTHVHEPVIKSGSEIAEKARDIHPLQFIHWLVMTTIALFFTSIGWSAGSLWFAVVFSVLFVASRVGWAAQCVRYGFHKGARVKLVDKQAE